MSDLNFRVVWGDLDLTDAPFGVEWGMDVGAPQRVSEALPLLLTDGEVEVSVRDSNRTMSWMVLVEAADQLAHAEAERDLALEAAKPRNELALDPGDGWGPASVFDTYPAQVDWLRDDDMERTGYRRYRITLNAHPFARPMDETVIDAVSDQPPAVPTTVNLDDGTSATGWTMSTAPDGWTLSGPTASGGSVFVEGAPIFGGSGRYTIGERRDFASVDMTATRWLTVDASYFATGFSYPQVAYFINGTAVTPIARVGKVAYFDCEAFPTLTSFEYQASFQFSGGTSMGVSVSNIDRTNVPPFVGTGRQQFRSLTVGGSARTQGSLQVALVEPDALGDVLVYTNADDGSGYQPACRQYRVDGGAITVDATSASGAYSPLDAATAETYDVPASTLPPGTYAVLARVKAGATLAATIGATARTRLGSTDSDSVNTGAIVSLTSGVPTIVSLGRLVLPPTATPAGSQAKVRLTVSTASRVDIDELWLFHTTLGALSWVSCGTGTPAIGGPFNRVWFDTASLDYPRPAIWLGTQEDRSDARHASGSEIRAFGTHVFPPGDVNLFTVTSNALYAAASLRFYPRWHSNAAA